MVIDGASRRKSDSNDHSDLGLGGPLYFGAVPLRDGSGWRGTIEGRATAARADSPSGALLALARLLESVAWSTGRDEREVINDVSSPLYERSGVA